jgi:hypothetical protein
MIHYSCDRCRKTIDPQDEVRYIVNLEVHAAIEPVDLDEDEDDRDYLEEIQEILEKLEDVADEPIRRHGSSQRTFDLCPACYRKFIQNPVGSDLHAQLGFSSN